MWEIKIMEKFVKPLVVSLTGLVFLSILSFPVFSQSSGRVPSGGKSTEYEWEKGVLKRMFVDTSGNGQFDYIVTYDQKGRKVLEEMDYNHDGIMDDFYYYEEGILIRREVDSNFDSFIDLWVYLFKGVYIEKYERDTNFDGIKDKVKVFGGS